MKKGALVAIIISVAVLLALVGGVVSGYNGLVESEQSVEEAKSTISTQLQRRADLIPNFISTVKGYSDYEQETFSKVTEARTSVSKANTVAEQQNAEAKLNGAIDVWVNAITEAYPELKANEHYTALMDELSGTENRIAVSRKDYNSAAKSHNVAIRKFPKNIIASIFGFDSVDYFEGTDDSEKVPSVEF